MQLFTTINFTLKNIYFSVLNWFRFDEGHEYKNPEKNNETIHTVKKTSFQLLITLSRNIKQSKKKGRIKFNTCTQREIS